MSNFNLEFDPCKVTSIAREVRKETEEEFARYHDLDPSLKHEYQEELLHQKIATVMYQLIDLTNTVDTRTIVKGMLEGANRNHRALQNQFFSDALILFMREYANQDKRFFDGRNDIIPEVFNRMLKAI